MIDRRQFVTGLVAVTAASSFPAVPAIAAPLPPAQISSVVPLVRVGRAFSQRDPELPAYFSEAFAVSCDWQCQVHGSTERVIRHCPSGLIFATGRRDLSAVWLVRPRDAPVIPRPTPEFLQIAYAARYIRVKTSIVDYLQRHSEDGRRGPFFLPAETGDEWSYADAPPLPRVKGFVRGVS